MNDKGQAITEYALIMVGMTLMLSAAMTVKFPGLDAVCPGGKDCPLGLALFNAMSVYAASYDFVLSLPIP